MNRKTVISSRQMANGSDAHATARSFVSFYLNRRFFGVDVLRVQEVIRQQPMTQVPLAGSIVKGLINLRGQVVLAFDLRKRLGFPGSDGDSMNLVVQTADGPVALIVDEIGDVIEADSQIFERAPEMLKGVQKEMVDGVYKLNKKLLIALNVDRVVQVNE